MMLRNIFLLIITNYIYSTRRKCPFKIYRLWLSWLGERNKKHMQTVAAHAQFQVTISDRREVDMSRVPVLTILGSTGCGKSRLGIELARRFSGEIISADSMQVSEKTIAYYLVLSIVVLVG